MVRPFAVAALVVWSFALPRGAAAEPPLPTICNSWQMEYCVRFLTHDVVQRGPVGEYGVQGAWSSIIEVFGPGYEAMLQTGQVGTVYMEEPIDQCSFGLFGSARTIGPDPQFVTGPGTYRVGDS